MKEGQTEIFYISGESVDHLRKSPQLEGFQAKGVEVLLLEDPVDDFWLSVVTDFEGKAFRSVTRGGVDLSDIQSDAESKEPEDSAAEAETQSRIDSLVAYMKLSLGDAVKDVQASKRLTSSACCLVADAGDMDLHLERMLKQHKQLDRGAPRILEINPKHALIQGLALSLAERPTGSDDKALADAAFLLLDQARIQEGESPADPGAFTKRLSELVLRGFQKT
jgi:molecular chaperone HtpG